MGLWVPKRPPTFHEWQAEMLRRLSENLGVHYEYVQSSSHSSARIALIAIPFATASGRRGVLSFNGSIAPASEFHHLPVAHWPGDARFHPGHSK